MLSLFLLISCGRPDGMVGCDSVEDPTHREDCRYLEALKLMGDRGALELAVLRITEQSSQDLLRLRMAVRDPVTYGAMCRNGVQTALGLERCNQLLDRRHLAIEESP